MIPSHPPSFARKRVGPQLDQDWVVQPPTSGIPSPLFAPTERRAIAFTPILEPGPAGPGLPAFSHAPIARGLIRGVVSISTTLPRPRSSIGPESKTRSRVMASGHPHPLDHQESTPTNPESPRWPTASIRH
jgi:hypothetical protein